ncbi:MAG: efflux RND transporter periplasmic adaptor subunit [Thermoguttaceae bacterium]
MARRSLFGIGFAMALALFLVMLFLAMAGCSRAPSEAPEKRIPTVTVSFPLEREVIDYQDYTGRTAAIDSVQVQARVTGYLDKIYFKEGAELTEGTVLYEIDPRQYQDSYDAAKAQVEANVANLKLARVTNTRNKELVPSHAASLEALDTSQSLEDQAIANLDTARANLASAKLNLDWTKITAPITGQIGRLLVTRGNLITANQTTLTTIVRQDPMWVYFDVDELTALKIGDLARQGKFGPVTAGLPKIPFHLQLANEKGFPHEAILDFINNQIDQGTATILVRAVFSNPKPANGTRVFTPNMFVRVRVPTSPPYQALLVSAEAVGTDQDLKYVYVVDEDNKVVRRAVKLGSLQDGLQVVTDGLKAGERVVVNGLQRVDPGASVNPRLVPMPIPAESSVAPVPPPALKAATPQPKK